MKTKETRHDTPASSMALDELAWYSRLLEPLSDEDFETVCLAIEKHSREGKYNRGWNHARVASLIGFPEEAVEKTYFQMVNN